MVQRVSSFSSSNLANNDRQPDQFLTITKPSTTVDCVNSDDCFPNNDDDSEFDSTFFPVQLNMLVENDPSISRQTDTTGAIRAMNASLTQNATTKTAKQYSKRCAALLVGQNYPTTNFSLNGCLNDISAVQKFLVQWMDPRYVYTLTDDEVPTTATSFLMALYDMALKSWEMSLDFVWIHYSGHGTSNPIKSDKNAMDTSEVDGMDEYLCFDDANLKDDIVSQALAKFNPKTTILFVCDACHSGTMVDLPFMLSISSTQQNKLSMINGTKSIAIPQKGKSLIISISGCRDEQTSQESKIGNTNQTMGSLTYYLMQKMKVSSQSSTNTPNASNQLVYVFRDMCSLMKRDGVEQVPQLCASVDILQMNIINNIIHVINTIGMP